LRDLVIELKRYLALERAKNTTSNIELQQLSTSASGSRAKQHHQLQEEFIIVQSISFYIFLSPSWYVCGLHVVLGESGFRL
jgi:hypothetical protein